MTHEMNVHRDLEYHGYPKTLKGLKNYEAALVKWTKSRPLKNHCFVSNFLYQDYKANKKRLKNVRKRIAALEKEPKE